MRFWRSWLVTGPLVLMALALPGGRAAGHGVHVTGVYQEYLLMDPYMLTLDFADWPLRVGRPNRIALLPNGGSEGKRAWLRFRLPGSAHDWGRSELRPDEEGHGWVLEYTGLPQAGEWLMTIELQGPDGNAQAEFSFEVAPAPPLPEWAWWVAGILGLAVVGGFLRWRRRMAARGA